MGREKLYAATSAAYPSKAGERGGVEVEDGNVKKGIAGQDWEWSLFWLGLMGS